MEGLGHIVVGAETETADLVLDAGEAGEDQNGSLHLGDTQRAEHFVAAHVGEIKVKQDDIVVVELAQIDTFLAEVGGVHVETFRFEHQFDALRRCGVVFDQEHTHAVSS